MRIQLSPPELLTLVEIVDEHVDRNFPGINPPHLVRDIREKFEVAIDRQKEEIAAAIQSSKTGRNRGPKKLKPPSRRSRPSTSAHR
jgi:hypothetical protein